MEGWKSGSLEVKDLMAEVENITIEEARELVSNRLLWPLIRDFLWDFASLIHESWIGSLEGAASNPPGLRDSSRVKRYILESLNVEPCFHTFPKDDFSRVLLLDGATLGAIVKWLGVLACADALRHVTDGATVRGLKASLSGVYPEVFGYTAYFGSLEALRLGSLEEGTGESGEEGKFGSLVVEKVGCVLLLQSVSSLPAPLMHRLMLKLPKRMTGMELPNLQTPKPPNLQTSIGKLLKLKFPEAYKLCCS